MQNAILAGQTTHSASKQPLEFVASPAGANKNLDHAIERPETAEASGSKTHSLLEEPFSSTVPPLGQPSSSAVPPLSSLSDSDNDALVANVSRLPMSSTQKTSEIATSNHPVINHPPVFSEGQVTAKELMTFDQRITRIITAFKDLIIHDRITSNCETLVALKFEEFMKQFCSMFLPKDWEENVCTQILGNKMSRHECFILWAQSLQVMNCVLRNTGSHLSDDHLRDTLEAKIDADL